jgi:SAM-dependent methyltransferase
MQSAMPPVSPFDRVRADITDPIYQTKFFDLPDIISDWAQPYLNLQNADILDFGCGEATTAMGFALRKRPRRVVGVDVVSDPELCLPYAQQHLDLAALPENIELHRVAPGLLHNDGDRFHLVYAWSVMEHVREDLLDATLSMLHDRLRDGGLLFVQISPLFYSSEGSHLFHKIPERWGHLRHQHSEYVAMLRHACASETEYRTLLDTYETLNRITAPRLRAAIENAGFTIVRDQYREEEFDIPPEVSECYVDQVLRLGEVVFLAERGARP